MITIFFPILSYSPPLFTLSVRANLSDDPRREVIRVLKTSVIAPLIAVCSHELQGAPSLLRCRKQNTSKTGTNITKCRA